MGRASGRALEIAFDVACTAAHISMVKIIFFAQSRDAAGCEDAHLEVKEPINAVEFWNRLIEKFANLASLRNASRLARRESYLEPGDLLEPEDEIAIIPPVSGG